MSEKTRIGPEDTQEEEKTEGILGALTQSRSYSIEGEGYLIFSLRPLLSSETLPGGTRK